MSLQRYHYGCMLLIEHVYTIVVTVSDYAVAAIEMMKSMVR